VNETRTRDLYRDLGVSPQATAEQIHAAYRRLAKRFHPDLGGEGHLFRVVCEAYNVLGDPHQRRLYDKERARSQAPRGVDFDPCTKAASTARVRPASAGRYPNSAPTVRPVSVVRPRAGMSVRALFLGAPAAAMVASFYAVRTGLALDAVAARVPQSTDLSGFWWVLGGQALARGLAAWLAAGAVIDAAYRRWRAHPAAQIVLGLAVAGAVTWWAFNPIFVAVAAVVFMRRRVEVATVDHRRARRR
jgi:curved DNA-binding protein CbpA